MRALGLASLALALLAAPTLAIDIVELKSGRVLEVDTASLRNGKIHVKLHVPAGDQVIAYSIPIAKVVPEFVFYVWAEQLKAGDATGHIRLADWARKNGLFRHAWRTYETASGFDAALKASLPELKTKMYEEEATWHFKEGERLFRAGEVKAARLRIEFILEHFADSQETGRAKELLSIIKEREQFLSEQKKQEEIAKRARKHKRQMDRFLVQIDKADRYVLKANFHYPSSARRRLSWAAYTYRKAAIGFTNLLPMVEVDALRETLKALLADMQGRMVRTFLKLADLRWIGGDSPGALDAVHEVLALDPDNKGATGLRDRILDGPPAPAVRGDFGFRIRRHAYPYPCAPYPYYGYPYRSGRVVKIGVSYPVYRHSLIATTGFGYTKPLVFRRYPFGYYSR